MAVFRVMMGAIQFPDKIICAGNTFEADPAEVDGLLKAGKICAVGESLPAAGVTSGGILPDSDLKPEEDPKAKYMGMSRDEMFALLASRGLNPSKACNGKQLIGMLVKSEDQAATAE